MLQYFLKSTRRNVINTFTRPNFSQGWNGFPGGISGCGPYEGLRWADLGVRAHFLSGCGCFTTGCDWVWVFYDWVWLGVTGCGRFMIGCDWVWTGCDWVWLVAVWVWLGVTGCVWVDKVVWPGWNSGKHFELSSAIFCHEKMRFFNDLWA